MKLRNTFLSAMTAFALATPASAALVSVAGPNSTLGTAPAIIAAPADVNDDAAVNTGLEGFNEVIGHVLAANLAVDGGTISAGTRVDSHMIFLNTRGNTGNAASANWTFDGTILGTMSNGNGSLEVMSSPFLGAPGTVYPLMAFALRGLESNDSLSFLGNILSTRFIVSEPGDWIRVVTVSAVPLPAALPLFAGGLGLMGLFGRRKKRQAMAV